MAFDPGKFNRVGAFGEYGFVKVLPEVTIADQFPMMFRDPPFFYIIDDFVGPVYKDLTIRSNVDGPVCAQGYDSRRKLSTG